MTPTEWAVVAALAVLLSFLGITPDILGSYSDVISDEDRYEYKYDCSLQEPLERPETNVSDGASDSTGRQGSRPCEQDLGDDASKEVSTCLDQASGLCGPEQVQTIEQALW